jgi:hypothetical protein
MAKLGSRAVDKIEGCKASKKRDLLSYKAAPASFKREHSKEELPFFCAYPRLIFK